MKALPVAYDWHFFLTVRGYTMKQKTFNYYQDAGHGWVKVSIADLKELGIDKNITSYSFMKKDYAYLEEDCDLTTLINALEANGLEFKYKAHISNWSSIRRYSRYVH